MHADDIAFASDGSAAATAVAGATICDQRVTHDRQIARRKKVRRPVLRRRLTRRRPTRSCRARAERRRASAKYLGLISSSGFNSTPSVYFTSGFVVVNVSSAADEVFPLPVVSLIVADFKCR